MVTKVTDNAVRVAGSHRRNKGELREKLPDIRDNQKGLFKGSFRE